MSKGESEFKLILRVFKGAGGSSKAFTRLGIGDDASIHQLEANQELVISTDTSIQSIHWPDDFPLDQAADRAVCSALSDLAAMGAQPACVWLNVMAVDALAVEQLGQGATTALQRYDIELAGGDTCRSATNALSVTVAGQLPKASAMQRNHAQLNDNVWLCGRVGLHALGLQQWFYGLHEGEFIQYFRTIRPLLEAGIKLREIGVLCCIDVSDGVLQDAGHICQASNVGMEIEVSSFPDWAFLCQKVGRDAALQAVIQGGEDYALLFTAPPHVKIPTDLAVRIGRCTEHQTIHLLLDGKSIETRSHGFDHFA